MGPCAGRTEVVDGLHAVRLHADGLEEELLGALVLAVHEEAVALVHQRLGVIAVVADGGVRLLVGLRLLALQEVEEGQVGRSLRAQRLVLLLEALQHLNGLLGSAGNGAGETGGAAIRPSGARTLANCLLRRNVLALHISSSMATCL